MSKPVELIEKNIQWVTLGAGVAFLGFIGYRYFASPPHVEVGGQTLTAGQVDAHTLSTTVAKLEEKMGTKFEFKPALPTLDKAFVELMAGPTTRPLDAGWTTARALQLDIAGANSGSASTRPAFDTTEAVADGKTGSVAELKALPAAVAIGTTQGLSTLNLAAMIAAGVPNMPPPPPAPPVPGAPVVPPTPPAPGTPTAQPVDKDWVTAAFEIPTDGIKATFDASLIPGGLLTTFLRLEVQREEQLPDGTFGKPTVLKPLANSGLSKNPMPPAGNLQAEAAYRLWADANQIEILQPGFYAVMAGQPWTAPGSTLVAPDGGALVFDPLKYLKGPIPTTLTKEERTAVLKARAAEAKRLAEEEAKKRAEERRGAPPRGTEGPGGLGGPGGGGGGPGGGSGGRGGGGRYKPLPPSITFVPEDLMPGPSTGGFASWGYGEQSGVGADSFVAALLAGGPLSEGLLSEGLLSGGLLSGGLLGGLSGGERFNGGEGYPVQNRGYVPPRPPGYPPGLPWPPPEMGGGQEPGDPGMQGMGPQGQGTPIAQANLGKIPGGPFDPQAWTDGNIIAFQHDDTVEPGKTYRYRARYVLVNPVYQQLAAVAKPELAATFRWNAEWSGWTEAATIPNKISFFVSSRVTSGAATIQVEVFRFLNGQMRSKVFNVTPGDLIGANDPALGDFSTGYTLVDIRSSGRGDGYALLLAPDGTIQKRDGSDSTSDRYKEIKKQTQVPAPVGSSGGE